MEQQNQEPHEEVQRGESRESETHRLNDQKTNQDRAK